MAQSAKDDGGSFRISIGDESSADVLYDIFRNKYELFPRLMPQVIKNVESISADVWLWTFVDDKCGTWKIRVECIEEARSVAWTLLDGEVPKKLYKTLKVEYQFSPSDQGYKAKVKLTYEKKDITVPVPNGYIDFILKMLKDVDEYLQIKCIEKYA